MNIEVSFWDFETQASLFGFDSFPQIPTIGSFVYHRIIGGGIIRTKYEVVRVDLGVSTFNSHTNNSKPSVSAIYEVHLKKVPD